jgi:phosphonate degradation associated HDIG domain protein
MGKADEICTQLRDMISKKGSALYGGEQVTQEQHALQAAHLAEQDGAPGHVIVAALLHDVGHLLERDFDQALDATADTFHEQLGEAFLKQWFGPDITEPVRLHVTAKRYRCATRPGYFESLSPASVHSLALQGGPMSAAEVAAFELEPHYRDAVRVRVYDDLAKDQQMRTPGLEHFLGYVARVVR